MQRQTRYRPTMNVRLLVLGLLQQRPMHGYELKRMAHENKIESWSGVLAGSIYHALKTLQREKLITVASQRDNKPSTRPRVVYSITGSGRRELKHLVKQALAAPVRGFPTDLYGALLHLEAVSPREKQDAITRQIRSLETEIAEWSAAARAKQLGDSVETGLLFDNALRHMRMNLDLLKRLHARRPRK
jgi:DNA-binding PadR family transcriptional regulator